MNNHEKVLREAETQVVLAPRILKNKEQAKKQQEKI